MGAPTKLTPELTEQIVRDIEAGNYAETAAQAAGIHVATFHNWMKWGAQRQEPYAAFFEAVTCARARAEVDLLQAVRVGDEAGVGFGPAKAAAFVLERTRPKKFAQRINVKVQEELESLLDVVERVCSAKDCGCHAEILEALTAGAGSEEASGAPGEPAPELH